MTPAVLLVLFGLLHMMNYQLHKGAYPTLHLSTFQLSQVALFGGLAGLAAHLEKKHRKLTGLFLGTAILSFLVVVAAPLKLPGENTENALRAFLRFTILGQSRVIYYSVEELDNVGGLSGEKKLFDQNALTRFDRFSNLPEFFSGFSLKDYNVILISIEATRYDETSLGNPSKNTTPNLKRLTKDGAYWFERAYTPSCQTMQTMSAIFAMSPVSGAPLDIRRNGIYGTLREETETVPELFSDSGYRTFWIGYNQPFFQFSGREGFKQGFDHFQLIKDSYPEQDARILDATLMQIPGDSLPFFGWIFFGSPHFPYKTHYPDLPAKTERDAYRQEIRFVDEQIGKLINHLKRHNLFDQTVIVIHADHGESFMEHGKKYHEDVYSEVSRVPLVIRIPGLRGGKVEGPTSVGYIFPWLFRAGTEKMQIASNKQLNNVFGPMLKATDGAVIVERLGGQNMRTSLVYPNYSLIYDYYSRYHELYDLRKDPNELNDIFGRGDVLEEVFLRRLAGYMRVRSATKGYKFKKDKKKKRKQTNLENQTYTQNKTIEETNRSAFKVAVLTDAKPEAIVAALGDDERQVRAAAVGEIRRRKLHDVEIIEALIPILADQDRKTRHSAISVFVSLGETVVPTLLRELSSESKYRKLRYQSDYGRGSTNSAICNVLHGIGRPVVPYLIEALNSPDVVKREKSAYVLGKIRDGAEGAVPKLLHLTRDSSAIVRLRAIAALAKIDPRDKQTQEAVLKALKDTDKDVKTAAKRAQKRIQQVTGEKLESLQKDAGVSS
ncbi:MAG: sulfatase-like hydrolase/transferase [Proteobacteria bacterium]|nr:sulfatase-like hydrolase/transferase [Pseudomonadota bacterium]